MDIFISYGSKAYMITALICLSSNIWQNPTNLFKIIEKKQSWTELSQLDFVWKQIYVQGRKTPKHLPQKTEL